MFVRPDAPVAISSPNYPGNYSNDDYIAVVLLAPPGTDVELIFLDLELAASCLQFNYGETYYTLLYMIKLSII